MPTTAALDPASTSIELRRVTKSFAHGQSVVPALADVDLSVEAGRFVSVLGPSGCGKSTLLRIVAGLVRADAGDVAVGGVSPDEARAAKRFGLVPQAPALLAWRSVLDNVLLPFEVNRRAGGGRAGAAAGRERAVALLESVGLGDFASSYPAQLSGGMQQRVAVARAFAFGAPILLMDEPFAALDEITRVAMRYALLDLWARQRTTVVFVTHSLAEAVILSDVVAVMSPRPGRIVGTREVALPRPRTEDQEDTDAFVAEVRAVRAMLRAGAEAGAGAR